jgi:uncharacterized damage-inducible protein DinB
MSLQALSCDEMLADFHQTADRWFAFFEANPGALEVRCDIAGTETVGQLASHIYAACVRLSQRLLEQEMSQYSTGLDGSLATMRGLQQEGEANLRSFLLSATPESLNEKVELKTRAGVIHVSRRKIFLHAMIHAIRHWAQVASVLRQNGFKTGWIHDFLGSSAVE